MNKRKILQKVSKVEMYKVIAKKAMIVNTKDK